MAWQWAETLVEIRGTLVEIRGNTKYGIRCHFPKHEFKGAVSYRFSQGLLTLMCNNSESKADINFFFFLLRKQTT